MSLDFKNQAYHLMIKILIISVEVNYSTDRNIFTQHFVQSSLLPIQQCCRKDRQWKMLSMFIHSRTVMLNSLYFAFDSMKHGNTRKHPDQIISKHILLPIQLCLFSSHHTTVTALVDMPVRQDMGRVQYLPHEMVIVSVPILYAVW